MAYLVYVPRFPLSKLEDPQVHSCHPPKPLRAAQRRGLTSTSTLQVVESNGRYFLHGSDSGGVRATAKALDIGTAPVLVSGELDTPPGDLEGWTTVNLEGWSL